MALAMAGAGAIPSIAALATEAGVSRATAYRYFRSRSELVEAIMTESLGPVRLFEPSASDGAARVRELFDRTFPRFKEFEPQMRAALQLSLEHAALAASGALAEPAYRRGFRRGILGRAAAPLAEPLGPDGFARLLRALSLIYGIEPYVVLKDVWGADDAEVEATARWVVEAILAKALDG
jgi:AcrR family transcriptional regulator